jgi:hypothetical protein
MELRVVYTQYWDLFVKCPKCFSGYISLARLTLFGRLFERFRPPAREERNLLRYRCTVCYFAFTAPDRRLLSRNERDTRAGLHDKK